MTTNRIDTYTPASWEKICAVIAGFWIIALATFLIIRNQPLEPNVAVIMRILLSMGVAIFGAVIPGFLNIDLTLRGVVIRAGGALALFVITFFFTPKVFHKSFQDEAAWENSQTGMPQLNSDFIRLTKSSDDPNLISLELAKLKQPHVNVISLMLAAEKDLTSISRPSKLVALYNYLSMANYQLAAIAKYRALHETDISITTQLHQEAISNAKMCIKYATSGLELNNKILSTNPKELSSQTSMWSESLYLLSQQKLREYDFFWL